MRFSESMTSSLGPIEIQGRITVCAYGAHARHVRLVPVLLARASLLHTESLFSVFILPCRWDVSGVECVESVGRSALCLCAQRPNSFHRPTFHRQRLQSSLPTFPCMLGTAASSMCLRQALACHRCMQRIRLSRPRQVTTCRRPHTRPRCCWQRPAALISSRALHGSAVRRNPANGAAVATHASPASVALKALESLS